MNQSTKAASIALGIVIALTTTKFILYTVSGSIAVLSEAWHSVADIATTLLVLISIIRQSKKSQKASRVSPGENGPMDVEEETLPEKGPSFITRAYRWVRAINTELKISFLIGWVLFAAALAILWNAIRSETVQVSAPLVSGIIFIVLSFGSFFLYRFEENIGSSEKSAALTADSHHNRADMVVSLLTGISLIVYYFGTNVDRWVGVFIALYILAFTAELIVNTTISIHQNRPDVVFQYRSSVILSRMFQAGTYAPAFQALDARIHTGQGVKAALKALPGITRWTLRWSIRAVVAAALVVYASTAVYSVNPDEKALVLRFGEIVNKKKPVLPGLHLKLPYPIDSVVRFQTGKIQTLTVGNVSGNEAAMIWTTEHGDDRTFISGDDNLFLPFIVIHFKIDNIHDYYLNNRNGVPETALAYESYRLLNRIFSETGFYDLILYKRGDWTITFKESLQEASNRLHIGLEIVEFCLRDLHPPINLAAAYEDVVAAGQLREKTMNTAQRHVNSLMSQARMQSFKTVAEAESYAVEKINIAAGEAKNYLLRYQGYQVGGDIIKKMLLLKSAEKTLQEKNLVLVDPNSGVDEKLIYIEKYMTRGGR